MKMNYCKDCKYRNELHLPRTGAIIEWPDCGKKETITHVRTPYKREWEEKESLGLKEKLNKNGKCPHYKELNWFQKLFN